MKDKKMSIRISSADSEAIHRKCVKANMTLTDYIVNCCLNKKIVIIDGLKDVIAEQKAISRNLNQLTMLCHMGKIEAPKLDDLVMQYADLNLKISELLKAKRR